MKSAVVIFPGSNCDRDAYRALHHITGYQPVYLWHQDTTLPDPLDLIVLPGGFSYGDYLRSGAIAARSPIMQAIAQAAARGVVILGICNGFQILTEAGLLPGALARNDSLSFRAKLQTLEVANNNSPFTRDYTQGQSVQFHIAHGDGRYITDAETLKQLEEEERIAFRYTGNNPNGSLNNIAGIFNKTRTILGMMPHPERVIDPLLGPHCDGRALFTSLLGALG